MNTNYINVGVSATSVQRPRSPGDVFFRRNV